MAGSDQVTTNAGWEGSATTPSRAKLLEVALPLEAINVASSREKSIRYGHPSTIHLWWARRPLAACRAVLFAQMVDDPSAVPDEFATELEQEAERRRLFTIIEELVKWENSENEAVLMAARREIARSVARSAGLPCPTTDADAMHVLDKYAPPALDPFCGAGSIPLEAQRLGLKAHASDLNPVAVLITKSLIEIPFRFIGAPPVNRCDRDLGMGASWKGAAGLAADIRWYGTWMRDEAERRVGHLYPRAKLPSGRDATVVAWVWARTIVCPNPACGARMPLVRSFVLSSKRGRERVARPTVDTVAKAVHFEISSGDGTVAKGTVDRHGAKCLVCGTHVPLDYVRGEGRGGRLDQQLMAVVVEGDREKVYLPPTDEQVSAAKGARAGWTPQTALPDQALGFRVQLYGMTKHCDLFTDRQLAALTTFADLVGEARDRALADAREVGLLDDGVPLDDGGSGATAYADAVAVYLAFAVDKLADRNSSLVTWANNREHARNVFVRQALSMSWDFSEVNPFSDSSGNFLGGVGTVAEDLAHLVMPRAGNCTQTDAASGLVTTRHAVISTDPPYYDNIGYADLSDFFYVWLRASLRERFPSLFRTILVPKTDELIAAPARFDGDRERAERFFETGLGGAFKRMRSSANDSYPLTVFYAFKQVETDHDGEILSSASTGWETMLAGLVGAGFEITGTWPMRTELGRRMRSLSSNALASSIVLVCRPRDANAPTATRREFVAALRSELPLALRRLTHASIAAVDLAQAAVGPGMRVFSRYAKVLESNGEPMTVRGALSLINQVLYEVEADAEGECDSDTRWAITWFGQYGMNDGPFGDAETLSKAKDTSVDGLQAAGILEARAGRVRLRRRDELSADWNPLTDRRLTVWEITQHLIRALDASGEAAAADLLHKVGGLGESAKDLAYALYLIAERKNWTDEGIAYNSLAVSWPEISRLAGGMGAAQRQLELE